MTTPGYRGLTGGGLPVGNDARLPGIGLFVEDLLSPSPALAL